VQQKWWYFAVGYVVGSFFGVSDVMGLIGGGRRGKNGA
jgi:hypothetical protein